MHSECTAYLVSALKKHMNPWILRIRSGTPGTVDEEDVATIWAYTCVYVQVYAVQVNTHVYTHGDVRAYMHVYTNLYAHVNTRA